MIQRILFLLTLICFTFNVNAQILFQKIPNENLCAIDAHLMQKGYKLAYSNMTSEDYLFKGNEEEWKKYWIELMQELNSYMHKKGLQLNIKNTCYNRVYFNQDGTIAAYLYHLNGLSTVQEQKFDINIFQFLLDQKLNIKASQNYWQYGTLRFE